MAVNCLPVWRRSCHAVPLSFSRAAAHDAFLLRTAVKRAMRGATRRVVADVLIHWVQVAGGYRSDRDRDGAWPYALQSYQALFATDEVA